MPAKLWQPYTQTGIWSRWYAKSRWLISRMGAQVFEQVGRWETRFDPCLRLGARIADRLGAVDHQFRNAIFDGAPGKGTDVVTVEFTLRQYLRGILGCCTDGVTAFWISPRQCSKDTAVLTQFLREGLVTPTLDSFAQQIDIISLSLSAQKGTDMQLVMRDIVVHLIQHQLAGTVIQIFKIKSHSSLPIRLTFPIL